MDDVSVDVMSISDVARRTDELVQRESQSWRDWKDMTEDKRAYLCEAVAKRMRELADCPEHWLPGSLNGVSNQRVDITFAVQINAEAIAHARFVAQQLELTDVQEKLVAMAERLA